jgi:hypothetical protein
VGDTVDRISFNRWKKIIEEFNKDYSNKLKTELEDAGFIVVKLWGSIT